MSKKTEKADAELAQLQVPSHSLPNETTAQASVTQKNAAGTLRDNASRSKAQRLRERIKPFPVARSTPGYQAVLEDIERRRGREMRHTLRTAEAVRKKQQYRNIALAALLVVALGIAALLFSRRG
ncbi:hypothetical protein ABB37_03797 [Leptomonas pyrrhocoris]|uniref:Uncharacterized protein n=1 Tax=Leptomonas pyrrhocoris TaxID=157538 RepID=A0A0M9G3E4_LEPPY|nr:hypothetical protein ABB37_03797 [Leptomonas pyrrhocoris]KPA81427.1 hypothetical protein ABB37_03797 [Leptomonas pyrrhocoris]|eukprot:XP_015659866.1 hypothetical protein ABB37_03797 [Leptomonas pyrrhocoris]